MSPSLHSSVVGLLTPHGQFGDWWEGGPLAVPFFGGQPLPVVLMDFVPAEDPTFLAEADAALTAFLVQGPRERGGVTPRVYANYSEMLEASDIEPLGVATPEAIWAHVSPQTLLLSRRSHREDREVYLQVACECAWEEEHGLQLVFRRGAELTRVSPQDGWLTDADAYGLPGGEGEGTD